MDEGVLSSSDEAAHRAEAAATLQGAKDLAELGSAEAGAKRDIQANSYTGPARTTKFLVSREAYKRDFYLLSSKIRDFLNIDDNVIWEMSSMHVAATDDENGRPYPGRLLYACNSLPADILDQPRDVNSDVPEIFAEFTEQQLAFFNRQRNISNYILEELHKLLYSEMLNLNAPDGPIPERCWTITIRK